MRICSFLPTATEMLCALGLGSSIVGRSQHCVYPPAVRSKPIVVSSRVKKIARQDSRAIHDAVVRLRKENTHQFEINLKILKRLKPDLVITQNLCSVCAASHSEVSEALRRISPRPREVILQAQRFDQVFSELKKLGRITGRKTTAERLVDGLQRRVDRVQKRWAQASAHPRVWCCEWMEPLMAAGHWIPEMVERAGGTDGLGQAGRNSRWITWQQVRSCDPEVILVMPCSYSIAQTLKEKRRLTRRPGWKSLSAVRKGRVFAVSGEFFHHAGPRLVNGVELLACLLHPESMIDYRLGWNPKRHAKALSF